MSRPVVASAFDHTARAVLNEILRDRLRVIREGLGISYGVRAHSIDEAVLVMGSIDPAYAAEAARAIVAELAYVRSEDPGFALDFSRARKRVLAQGARGVRGHRFRGNSPAGGRPPREHHHAAAQCQLPQPARETGGPQRGQHRSAK